VIAHRGAAAEAPENTVEAFDLALQLGADALELDVQRAADGTLVVIHDKTVDRTTAGRGRVAKLDAGELGRLSVPKLEEVFGRYEGLEITVDVKDASASGDVVKMIRSFGRVETTILYVEDGTSLGAFLTYAGRRASSTSQAAWLAHELVGAAEEAEAIPADFPEVLHTELVGPAGPIVTPALVDAVHRTERTVQVWTIDDGRQMCELAEWGVDGLITNDVRRAVTLLKDEHESD
jgi:glycerophosphoryl diester phosphodiesterase